MKINITKYAVGAAGDEISPKPYPHDGGAWVTFSDYESLFWRFEAAMAWLEEMKEYLPEGVIEGLELEDRRSAIGGKNR